MMTKIRKAALSMAERRDARRLYLATAHLDPSLLRDVGINRDDWLRMSFPRV